MVNFGRSVRPSGQKYLAIQFLFIRLFGFSHMSKSPIVELLLGLAASQ